MHSSRLLSSSLLLAIAALGPLSCNPYDLLMHDRFEQSNFDSDVDILWVVDNSDSMLPIQAEIQANFGSFIEAFANVDSEEGQEISYDTIADAVTAWAEFQTNQERFLNYNMGVITTDIESQGNGNTGNLRDLTAVGSTSTCSPTILTPETDDVVNDFTNLVDVGIGGAGNETSVLSAAFALCKGQDQTFWDGIDSRPDTDPVKIICSQVPDAERSCNEGFFRGGATTVVIAVSDEGDDTYRSGAYPPGQFIEDCVLEHNDDPNFGDCDCRLSWFLDFFDAMEQPVVWATIAPTYQLESDPEALCDGSQIAYPGPCNEHGSPVCSLDFYQNVACYTGGQFTPIQTTTTVDDPQSCVLANFQDALGNIGAMISNLSRGWILSTLPDEETIQVFVDGVRVPHTSEDEGTSGGWRYLPQDRAIGFTGTAIPGYNTDVDIYYYPLHDRTDNVGRNLPF